MFGNSFSSFTGAEGTRSSSIVAAVSAAISYAEGMETADIVVNMECGVLCLEGVAESEEAILTAVSIANDIADCPVSDRLQCRRGTLQ